MNGPEVTKYEGGKLEWDLAQVEGALDEALQEALRQVEPPEGFAQRVLARATSEEPWEGTKRKGKLLRWVRRKYAVSAALAASLAVGAFVAEGVHQRREREQAATAQFQTAERITQQTVQQVRQQIERAGVRLED